MKSSITLGRIWGIPIGLHTSWFIVFGLITLSLSAGYFSTAYPGLSGFSTTLIAVVTSLLFFGSVLAHELGHAFVAIREKIPVKGITLFIFGGVAQISQEPGSPGSEFRIAIFGPLTSLGLALLFGGVWLLSPETSLLVAPSMYLARINLILAVFNMIPGFPLDGGRVLRALVWWRTKSFQRATKFASITGQVVAFGFIGFGVLNIFTGDFAEGLWMTFIGWFLQSAASSSSRQVEVQERLRGTTVSQAMSRDCAEVNSLTTLHQLVQERVLTGGQHCFFVLENDGKIHGMLTLQDITKVPQLQWRFTTAGDVMVPFNRLLQVNPETDLVEALKAMDTANVSQAPVVHQDRPIGLISKDQVLRYLQLRTQLGM